MNPWGIRRQRGDYKRRTLDRDALAAYVARKQKDCHHPFYAIKLSEERGAYCSDCFLSLREENGPQH